MWPHWAITTSIIFSASRTVEQQSARSPGSESSPVPVCRMNGSTSRIFAFGCAVTVPVTTNPRSFAQAESMTPFFIVLTVGVPT